MVDEIEGAGTAPAPGKKKATPARRAAPCTTGELRGLLASVVDASAPLADAVARVGELGRAFVVDGGEVAAVALSPQEYDRLVRDAGRRG